MSFFSMVPVSDVGSIDTSAIKYRTGDMDHIFQIGSYKEPDVPFSYIDTLSSKKRIVVSYELVFCKTLNSQPSSPDSVRIMSIGIIDRSKKNRILIDRLCAEKLYQIKDIPFEALLDLRENILLTAKYSSFQMKRNWNRFSWYKVYISKNYFNDE